MIVGIWGDNHGNTEKIKDASRLFEKYRVSLVLNAGDSKRRDIYDELEFPMIGILGNWDNPNIFKDYKNAMGFDIEFHTGVYEFFINGKIIALYHGTLHEITDSLIKSQKYDIVVAGHNHIPSSIQEGKTLYINPGHFKVPVRGDHPDYKIATIAFYDTSTNEVWFEPLV